jgi:hypothetical protein
LRADAEPHPRCARAGCRACRAQLLLWRAGDPAPTLAPGDAEQLVPLAQAEGLGPGADADEHWTPFGAPGELP